MGVLRAGLDAVGDQILVCELHERCALCCPITVSMMQARTARRLPAAGMVGDPPGAALE